MFQLILKYWIVDPIRFHGIYSLYCLSPYKVSLFIMFISVCEIFTVTRCTCLAHERESIA